MKQFLFLTITFLALNPLFAQDSSKVQHEIGSKIVSFTLPTQIYYTIADQPNFQFVNGLFYRLSKGKIAFRAILNYSQNRTESFYEDTDEIWTSASGFSFNKDFQISVGGQYALLKRKKFLYFFTDLYYRNLSSQGELSNAGGWGQQSGSHFFAITDQTGLNTGLGFKIKLSKHIYLSPEIFCDMFISHTSLFEWSNDDNSETDTFYSTKNIRPAARLFLSISF